MLRFGPCSVVSVLTAALWISFAGRPIGVGAATRDPSRRSTAHRSLCIFLLTGFYISIYLIIVMDISRPTEPIKVAGVVVRDK